MILCPSAHLSSSAATPLFRRFLSCCDSSNNGSSPTAADPSSFSATAVPVQTLKRKQNAKSTSRLNPLPGNENETAVDKDKDILLAGGQTLSDLGEESRPAVFPGSISPLRIQKNYEYFNGVRGEERLGMVKEALELRRKAMKELLIEAMRGSRFSITYSTNVASCAGGFLDYLMIQAVGMRRLPEFAHLSFTARAKMCITSSGVVPLIRWLKHNSLTYPQIGKLISLAARDLENLRHIIEWLKTVHVKGRYLGHTLTKVEVILDQNVRDLDELVGYLETRGVRRDWLGLVISRCPQILSFDIEELKTRVNFFLELGVNEKDFGTMVFASPKVFGFLTLNEMKEKVDYMREFGLDTQGVGRLLALKPQLMGCSIRDKWQPLVKYFYYLGINRDGMRRIIAVKPMIFCVDLETTIAPKVRFLRDVGVREDAIGNMIVKFPPLLTYSLYKKIRPVVIFLITKAGVAKDNIGKVIALEPELLGCSITNKLEVNVKYFLSLGIPVRSLGEMVVDFPMLLKYNLEVLRPKYRYLRQTMVRPLKDLIEFPRFFSYSLDGRIIPRHKILLQNHLNFKLRYMLAATDGEFDNRVKLLSEAREKFESQTVGAILSQNIQEQ